MLPTTGPFPEIPFTSLAKRRISMHRSTPEQEKDFVRKHEPDYNPLAFRAWLFEGNPPVPASTPVTQVYPDVQGTTASGFIAGAAKWKKGKKLTYERGQQVKNFLLPHLRDYIPSAWTHLNQYYGTTIFLCLPVHDIAMAAALDHYVDLYHNGDLDVRRAINAISSHPNLSFDKLHDIDMYSPAWKLLKYLVASGFADVVDDMSCVMWRCLGTDACTSGRTAHDQCPCMPCTMIRNGIESVRMIETGDGMRVNQGAGNEQERRNVEEEDGMEDGEGAGQNEEMIEERNGDQEEERMDGSA